MIEQGPVIPAALAQALREAQHVVALTGAGVSAESGVPTFRDAQTGLWARFRPEELATPQAFERTPQLVWDWYSWRRELVARAAPNQGHLALAELERRVPRMTLITQNVDGLHAQAGSSVIELHGNIARARCSLERTVVERWEQHGADLPRCPDCSALLRPDVVWFGEQLPRAALEQAWSAAGSCDLFLSIGTSGLVEPAASLPHLALRHGALLVEVNPERTPLTPHATYALHGPSALVLPALLRAAWDRV